MSDLEKRVNELEMKYLKSDCFRPFDTRPGSKREAEAIHA